MKEEKEREMEGDVTGDELWAAGNGPAAGAPSGGASTVERCGCE
jgi:hypothetical protein